MATSDLLDLILNDVDLYNVETREITDAGVQVIRTALAQTLDLRGADLLDEVTYYGNALHRKQAEADLVENERDAAIRAAVTFGHNQTKVAELAGISRQRLHQILHDVEAG